MEKKNGGRTFETTMKPYFSNRYQSGLPLAGGWSSV